jgi:glutamate 5-kinase
MNVAASANPSTPSREFVRNVKTVVIKVGSAVLTDMNGLDRDMVASLSRQIAMLGKSGVRVVLVSSGAIAAGAGKMPGHANARTIPEKQALAAIGQSSLMQAYEESFQKFGLHVAQILITRQGLIPRNRYINAKNTVITLMEWGVIPVINENDTVAVEELQFTDNDALAVLMVNLAEADLLICLSDTDGLYDGDPGERKGARIVREVARVDSAVFAMAGKSPGRAGRGGMRSKLESARMATACGIPMIIAGGRTPDVIGRIFAGEETGTLFHPSENRRINGRKAWIALALEREGSLLIDDGAVEAIVRRGKSLLPAGLRRVEGTFDAGACVMCRDSAGEDVALGIANYSADDLRKLAGCKCSDMSDILGCNGRAEVIHRDNMVIL